MTAPRQRPADVFDGFVVHETHGLIGQTRAGSRPDIESAARSYLQEQGGVAPGARIRVIAR